VILKIPTTPFSHLTSKIPGPACYYAAPSSVRPLKPQPTTNPRMIIIMPCPFYFAFSACQPCLQFWLEPLAYCESPKTFRFFSAPRSKGAKRGTRVKRGLRRPDIGASLVTGQRVQLQIPEVASARPYRCRARGPTASNPPGPMPILAVSCGTIRGEIV
jgi:hypothetical protein